ncbi:HEAT repeat domain-containing protein [Micromonospora cremea]|uniref:HEAT repeat domain-containing protein n=1 Tax=Micromonospora cremea TaxID=709881 RepID=UPI0013564B81|nr:HEAT repeat domain-containing protein [Micromonospora cremea]
MSLRSPDLLRHFWPNAGPHPQTAGRTASGSSYSLLPVWRRQRSWDAVDWSSVQHAYGQAVEVPDLLGRLRSRDREARRSAYQGLFDLLVHQGSRYEASAVATPFLVEIVADPKAPDRFAACQVLAAIAVGDESSWLIDRPDVAKARREVERQAHLTRAQLEQKQADWAAAGSTDHERRARARRNEFSDVESDRDAARWQIAAYDAARAGVPAYLAALASPETPVRLHAAHLLAWFPEERESIAPALAHLIGAEPQPMVTAAASVAAGLCGGADDPELVNALSARRGSDNRGERWSVVLGLARLVSRPDRPLIEELYACLFGAVGPVPYWPMLNGDMATFAALTIRDLDPAVAPDRVQTLVDRLNAPADDTDRYLLLRAALDTAFLTGPIADGTAFTDLDADQRTAVAGLQHSGILNDGAMVSMLLDAYNLPRDEAAMTRWCDSDSDHESGCAPGSQA